MKLLKFAFSVFKLQQMAVICCGIMLATSADAAGVAQRGAAARPSASRANAASKMPVIQVATAAAVAEEEIIESAVEPETEQIAAETAVIENKSSQFDKMLGTTSSNATDKAADERAEAIRRQRAALDSAAAMGSAAQKMGAALASNSNACDAGLRDCMKQACGNDFSKCAGDGDTIWGDKLDRCKRDLKCSGEEFDLFAKEIKADRDMNAKMASYAETLDCGNRYNSCIVEKCGASFGKCLGKVAGDKAVADCATVAKNCQSIDSGLSSRVMQVFGTLRQGAEVQAKKDEERLYELRKLMSEQCKRLGAMFDERSLDCVFTVNFFANNTATPYASKKAYAGDTFDCTQNWFGIDITTFKENAYRLTRSQTAASSAMLGAGLGTAAGAISSGAIGRAMDTAKAEKALDKAEKEHEENYGDNKKEDKGTPPLKPPSDRTESDSNKSNETSSDDKKIDKPNTTENDKTNEEKEKEALKETGSTMRRSINNANTIDSLKKGQFEAQRKANEAEKKGDIEAANRYRSDAKGLGDVAQDIAKDNKNKVKVPLGKITDDKKQSPVIQRPPTPANSGAK